MGDSRRIAVSTSPTLGRGTHIVLLDTGTGKYDNITFGPGEEREPAISPDGDRMAFASGGNASDLYEALLDGSSVNPLLATPRHQYSADWAPSGWQFTYVSDASGVPEIWIRSVSEGWAMPVIRDSPDGQLGYASPRFSPDGQKIAYVRVGSKHWIWISNLSGGVAAPLEQESADQHAPAWSPDGHSIAYVRYQGDQWELAKAPSGGGLPPVRIAAGGTASSKVEWSPSGEWICFSEADELRIVGAAGGVPVPFAKGAATFTFSRDGRFIHVLRRGADRKWEIVPLSVPSGAEGKATALRLPRESVITAARLHPDGKRLILSVSQWNRDIWILEGLRRPVGLSRVW
jgi:dipeptidyl aminopeptidase/acylaminoacyl peptidase